MAEVEADQLKEAVENMHGGTATLVQSVPVRETFEGKTAWEGVVYVFDLAGHLRATRAYAWSSPIEGSTARRFFAVLHSELLNSPLEAVRAAVASVHLGRFALKTTTCTFFQVIRSHSHRFTKFSNTLDRDSGTRQPAPTIATEMKNGRSSIS